MKISAASLLLMFLLGAGFGFAQSPQRPNPTCGYRDSGEPLT